MESKNPEQSPTWRGKDGLTYQDKIRRKWAHEEFPFRPGDRVVVKGPDTVWDTEGREHFLAKGMQGMVTEICHDPEWTTHVQVDFPDLGRVYVGWDVLARDEPSNEIKDHEQQSRFADTIHFKRFRSRKILSIALPCEAGLDHTPYVFTRESTPCHLPKSFENAFNELSGARLPSPGTPL